MQTARGFGVRMEASSEHGPVWPQTWQVLAGHSLAGVFPGGWKAVRGFQQRETPQGSFGQMALSVGWEMHGCRDPGLGQG